MNDWQYKTWGPENLFNGGEPGSVCKFFLPKVLPVRKYYHALRTNYAGTIAGTLKSEVLWKLNGETVLRLPFNIDPTGANSPVSISFQTSMFCAMSASAAAASSCVPDGILMTISDSSLAVIAPHYLRVIADQVEWIVTEAGIGEDLAMYALFGVYSEMEAKQIVIPAAPELGEAIPAK